MLAHDRGSAIDKTLQSLRTRHQLHPTPFLALCLSDSTCRDSSASSSPPPHPTHPTQAEMSQMPRSKANGGKSSKRKTGTAAAVAAAAESPAETSVTDDRAVRQRTKQMRTARAAATNTAAAAASSSSSPSVCEGQPGLADRGACSVHCGCCAHILHMHRGRPRPLCVIREGAARPLVDAAADEMRRAAAGQTDQRGHLTRTGFGSCRSPRIGDVDTVSLRPRPVTRALRAAKTRQTALTLVTVDVPDPNRFLVPLRWTR